MNTLKMFARVSLALSVMLTFTSCGGGGGGGGDETFVSAANVTVQVSPSEIDTGDRSLVTVHVSQVHQNGILLKIKVPSALSYALNTAFLDEGDNHTDIGPDKNVTKDNFTYLVFFLTQSDFGQDNEGTVTLQLTGDKALTDGVVAVDADVNDPLVDDGSEFNVNNPDFQSQDEASITVNG